jgi:D-tyrosyl-tRNA(Tyr) deacylase
VEQGDQDSDAKYLAAKTVDLRIFNDSAGKLNLSLADVRGRMLVVSQFTLLGDARKGRRPSFIAAADPNEANRLYQVFVDHVRLQGIDVETGRFQAEMDVEIVNNGPVTILLDSRKRF